MSRYIFSYSCFGYHCQGEPATLKGCVHGRFSSTKVVSSLSFVACLRTQRASADDTHMRTRASTRTQKLQERRNNTKLKQKHAGKDGHGRRGSVRRACIREEEGAVTVGWRVAGLALVRRNAAMECSSMRLLHLRDIRGSGRIGNFPVTLLGS
jgi:hypothetical protein